MEKNLERIAKALEQLQEKLEQSKGETITIKEWLTTNECTYDRHFTSFSHFRLQIERSGLRFSGARFWIEGFDENNGNGFDETTGIKIVKPSAYYEISSYDLIEILFDNTTVILIEKLSDKWSRKTEIIFCPL